MIGPSTMPHTDYAPPRVPAEPGAERDADHELVAAMDAAACARTQIVVVLLAAIGKLGAEIAAAQQDHAAAVACVGDLVAIVAADGGYMAPEHQAQFARARRLIGRPLATTPRRTGGAP